MWVRCGGGVDRIWRDLIGGWILMLAGSGRNLRSLMDGMGMIAMGDGDDIIDVGASITNYFTWMD